MRFFKRKTSDAEITDEMRFHIDMEAAELERGGMKPADARRHALATFGGVRRLTEEGHEARGGAWMDDLMRDVRYSIRSLRRTPGYAAVVLLTLAIGVAANVSIFSVAKGVLFKRLPYRDPSRLLVLWDGLDWIGVPEAWVTGPEVDLLRHSTTQFEGFSTVRTGTVTVGGDRGVDPQQVPQSSVSANFFQLLGAGPDLGRGFNTGDDAPGAPRLAVISRKLWMQRFGADSALLGKPILIDGVPTTVIGVLPPTFRFAAQSSLASATGDIDVYVPMTDTLARFSRSGHSLGVLARVRSDVPPTAALAELGALSKQLDKTGYGSKGFRFVPVSLQERMVREVRPALYALLGGVAVLMVIMCANLAVLALIRAARREHELTVRRAIGASAGRVARQILSETLVLSFGGALLGTLLGTWALRALLTMAPPGLPRRDEIGIDLTVLGVTLLLALAVGIVIGLAPVLQSGRSDIAAVLREKSPSRTGGRIRRGLVLAQLALSMVLLAGTGLLLSSFMRLMRADAGFDARGVLTVQLLASRAKYAAGVPVVDAFSRHLEAIRAIPGVVSAAATSAPPLSAGTDQSGLRVPSSPTNTGDMQHDGVLVDIAPVTADYLRTMGIPILEGREFGMSERDTAGARAAIIDETLAKRYFPKGGELGQRLVIDGDTANALRVVGVSRRVRMYNMGDPGREQVWVPHSFTPYRAMTIVIRTTGEPLALAAAVRRAIHGVDPEQPIANIATMDAAVRNSLSERRLVLTLIAAFAGAAIFLAALGVYGVTTSTVSQRTRELGIRMALGATRRRVIWSVLREPTMLVAFGLLLGLGGTYGVGRLAAKLLYGVSPTDPVTLGAVSLLLLVVGAMASYVPALRATRVDPVTALRAD